MKGLVQRMDEIVSHAVRSGALLPRIPTRDEGEDSTEHFQNLKGLDDFKRAFGSTLSFIPPNRRRDG